jgi:hypothetical protein
MATTRLIKLFDKTPDGEGHVDLIAECNDYDENQIRVRQLSRSPFTFQDTLTDEEIIEILRTNEYSRYF